MLVAVIGERHSECVIIHDDIATVGVFKQESRFPRFLSWVIFFGEKSLAKDRIIQGWIDVRVGVDGSHGFVEVDVLLV